MKEVEYLQNIIEKTFIRKHLLKSGTKQHKAIFDCARQLTASILYCDINYNSFLSDYENDNIINDINVFLTPGTKTWTDAINPIYVELAKDLFKLRPTGLGTPNSAVGEGEFMLSCFSPKVSKPKKGDVQFNNGNKPVIAEIKNAESRVFAPTNGVTFNKKCLEIGTKYKFSPNTTKNKLKGNVRFGVELAEKSKKEFYDKQFEKLSEFTRVKVLKEWFLATQAFSEEQAFKSASKGFDTNGKILPEEIQKEILKRFNRKDLESRDEYSVKLFFNEDKLTVIDNNADSFDQMVDSGIIKPTASYFRIFQQTGIGWYYKAFI